VATYYVAEGGTAANKGAATTGTYPGGCMDADTCNSQSYSAGDEIHFSDEGGDIRGSGNRVIDFPSSGSSGTPIILKAKSGDSPVIKGSDIITGWSVYDGNVWEASLTTEPTMVFFDGTYGTNEDTLGNVDAENEWHWAANTLYVYSTSDPDTAYTDPGIEASQRIPVNLSAQSYVTIDGLTVIHSDPQWSPGIRVWSGSNNIVQNCTARYCRVGIDIIESDDCVVDNCIAEYCTGVGINAHGDSETQIDNFELKNSTARYTIQTEFVGGLEDGYGLKFCMRKTRQCTTAIATITISRGLILMGAVKTTAVIIAMFTKTRSTTMGIPAC